MYSLLFNAPEVLTSADKANHFVKSFSSNSALDDCGQNLSPFLSRTNISLSSVRITPRLVARGISNVNDSETTGANVVLSLYESVFS